MDKCLLLPSFLSWSGLGSSKATKKVVLEVDTYLRNILVKEDMFQDPVFLPPWALLL